MIALRRVIIAATVVLGALSLLAPPGAAKPSSNPLADPTANTVPSQRFVNACSGMGTGKAANQRCDAAALKDFDAVRKKEGLGPMMLPRDFATLSVPSQLLAISDIERVDRGLHAVLGRTSSLDKLAQTGANQDRDPDFPNPFPGNSGGANWAAAGNSALLDDFYWMYDDGLHSFNGDCQPQDQSGCWGHRHDIINAYSAPVVMGAAVAYKTNWGTSMTEEFIGGDTHDKVNVAPSWHAIAATFPVRVVISAGRTKVASGHAVTLTGTVRTHVSHAAVVGQRVQLQQRGSATSAWRVVRTRVTKAHGVLRVVVRPTHATLYRFVALTKNGAPDGHSAAIRIVIA